MKKLVFILFILPNLLFSQGAIDGYMKAKKEMDIALTYSTESYDEYWFGEELQPRKLKTETASLFLARGIGKNATMIVSLPYMWTEDESSLQDAILAIKFRNKFTEYKHGKLSKITSLGFSFPVGDYDTNAERPIGEKAVSFQLRHLYQYENNSGWFIHLQSGFDFRVIPDGKIALPIIFRTGWAAKKFYVDGWLDFFHTFNSGDNIGITDAQGSEFLKIGGTFYYSIIPQFGVFVGGAQYLTGKNIGKASRVNLGLVYKFLKN